MVEAAGADLVDINFGCPVRKVTKTGAGATLLEDPDRACRIVEAVAAAVDVPVTVKMRRGLENGSRACLERRAAARRGRRRVAHAPSALGAADVHRARPTTRSRPSSSSLVDVPVIASGDVTSRARAQAVLATTGAAAVMVGRARAGQPVGAARDRRRRRRRADPRGGRRRARPLRPRDRARARRAPRGRVPEEVLRLVPRPRPLPAAVQAGARRSSDSTEEVETRLLAAAPGAPTLVERLEARAARPATRSLLDRSRSRSTAAAEPALAAIPLPDEPQASSVGTGRPSRSSRECGAISSARPPSRRPARRRRARRGCASTIAVHLAGEAVDEAGLERRRRRLADHASAARRSRP